MEVTDTEVRVVAAWRRQEVGVEDYKGCRKAQVGHALVSREARSQVALLLEVY